jgi:uncharacterized protein YndB with AHSA1/START domain
VKKIIHFVHIHAAPEAVYRSLTAQEGLSGWWTTRVRAPETVGGVISFRFTGDFGPEMEITRLESNRRVDWKCVGDHANWKDNTFSFDLDERKGETGQTFVQIYAQELSDDALSGVSLGRR